MLSQVQAIRNITCRSAYEKCGSAHDRYVVTTVSLESVLYTDPEANMAAIEKMVELSNQCATSTDALDVAYRLKIDELGDKMCSELSAVIEKYTAELNDISAVYTKTISDICDGYYKDVVSDVKFD